MGEDPPDPEDLARAEAALAALEGEYLKWARQDLARLRQAVQSLRQNAGEEALVRIFAIAHDMKGQAATFGYPQVGELGRQLCRLVEACRSAPSLAASQVDAIAALVEAVDQALPPSCSPSA